METCVSSEWFYKITHKLVRRIQTLETITQNLCTFSPLSYINPLVLSFILQMNNLWIWSCFHQHPMHISLYARPSQNPTGLYHLHFIFHFLPLCHLEVITLSSLWLPEKHSDKKFTCPCSIHFLLLLLFPGFNFNPHKIQMDFCSLSKSPES